MAPQTQVIHSSNFDDRFIGLVNNIDDASFEASRNEASSTLLKIASNYFNECFVSWAGHDCVDTSSDIKIGQNLVDPIAEINSSDSINTLIAISRKWISEKIASYISEIHNQPLEKNELPLNVKSMQNLLKYCFSKGVSDPIISATYDGLLQADWESQQGETFTVRFLPDNKALVSSRTNQLKGTVEVDLDSLKSSTPPITIPFWANE